MARLNNGAACAGNNQCVSGFCVAGVCCNSGCGACGSCSTGTCAPLNAGSTGSPACSPFVCDGTNASCPTACSVDANCVSTDYCSNKNCVAKLSDGSACTGANQCSSGACTTFYKDGDGDGYGNPAAPAGFCGTSAPSGYVSNNGDCCDTDKAANPGVAATAWFTSADACGSFDYNCDGVATQQYTSLGYCTTTGTCDLTTGLSCSKAIGWAGSTVPACGALGNYISGCGIGNCCSCSDPCGCGRPCGATTSSGVYQPCH